MSDKQIYKIKSKSHGNVYVAFSKHATDRLTQRGVNLIEVLSSICEHSDRLLAADNEEEIAYLDNIFGFSLVLAVSKTEKSVYYVNIITVMNAIPLDDANQPKFKAHDIIEVY